MPGAVKALAAALGFDACRIAAAAEANHADAFRQWLADGCHGTMAWLERTPERRCDPREVLPGCRSVICLAINYYPGASPFPATAPGGYRIAKYAWNHDYHDLLDEKLREFDAALQARGGTQRYYTDTGPVLERDFASAAGLGWNGKSTVQIHRTLGTWFFLAEILTTLELPPDPPLANHCGSCVRCLTACP
ncbi:MAG: tRNA epoxyqueuosine(34) reductase QueG, partial [Verrucomicrobiota bacterium]